MNFPAPFSWGSGGGAPSAAPVAIPGVRLSECVRLSKAGNKPLDSCELKAAELPRVKNHESRALAFSPVSGRVP